MSHEPRHINGMIVSRLEDRAVQYLERHGLVIVRQFRIGFYHYDGAVAQTNIVIDIDGTAYHTDNRARYADACKDARAKRAGYSPYRVTQKAMNQSMTKAFAEVLAEALRQLATEEDSA